ncbi:MAG: acyl carrier protein [Chloroflexota bacterium]|jgi:acyl carrier protein|nr:acyl carrier protein [Chloroflexota bacterium]
MDISTTISQYIVTKILRQPKKVLKPTDKLISSGLIDSFSLMDLSAFVEEKFGVRLEDTELNAETFDTVAQLASIVQSRQ